jgi:uncharacterized protein (TIGR02996 family)
MLDREPFLTAIFADPADDLPRLVFADFLDDRGEGELAALIRLEQEYLRTLMTAAVPRLVRYLDRRAELLDAAAAATGQEPHAVARTVRGLFRPPPLEIDAATLADAEAFRRLACERHPYWYGATTLELTGGLIATPGPLAAILTGPVTARVTTLVLRGREEHLGATVDDRLGIRLIDYVHKPVVTPRMVEHLAGMREARRLVALDLSCNELDNDAVRAVVRSTNLIRLKELTIQDGNPRVKGRLWGELLERFGPEVVH